MFYKCPLCLDRFDVPPGGVNALPTNRAIQEIAEKYHASAIKKGRPQNNGYVEGEGKNRLKYV